MRSLLIPPLRSPRYELAGTTRSGNTNTHHPDAVLRQRHTGGTVVEPSMGRLYKLQDTGVVNRDVLVSK